MAAKEKPKHLGTIVYLRWTDSALYTGHVWERSDFSGVMENESCGLLLSEDGEQVTLVLDHALDTDMFRAGLSIPRSAIHFEQRFPVP